MENNYQTQPTQLTQPTNNIGEKMEKVSRFMQGAGTFLIGISLLLGIGYGVTFIADEGGSTVTVTGKAIKQIKPNEVTISGTYEEKADNSDNVRNKTKEKASKGLQAIKDKGIEEKKINTDSVSVYPITEWRNGKNITTGYRASTTLSVRLEDTSKSDEIISTLTSTGANSTSGPTTGLTSEYKKQLEGEMRLEAISDAKEQAKSMAKQAGGKTGKIISISGASGVNYGSEQKYYAMEAMADSVSSAPASSDITFSEKEATLTVSVKYRLK